MEHNGPQWKDEKLRSILCLNNEELGRVEYCSPNGSGTDWAGYVNHTLVKVFFSRDVAKLVVESIVNKERKDDEETKEAE